MGALISRILGFFVTKSNDNGQSSGPQQQQQQQQQQSQEAPKVYSWDLRKNIDPKDYTIENKKGETIVKMPGSINGNQFIIKNLENCSVYLFDSMALLTIDDCKNCKFFCGPNKGSLFIRNSTDCAVATLCQQFRTRDCKNVTTFILCTSMPIIESSTQMKFACLTCNYNGLAEQIKASNLTVFNSNWSTIHDFTRVPGTANFLTLDKSNKLENYINYPDESIKRQLNVSFDVKDSIIPFSIGTAAKTSAESCLVILFFDAVNPTAQNTNAKNIVQAIAKAYPDMSLVNCKNFVLNEVSSENVFQTKDYNRQLSRGPIIGFEFNGPNCIAKCQAEVQKLKLDNNQVYVSLSPDSVKQQLDNFYNYSDMQMFS